MIARIDLKEKTLERFLKEAFTPDDTEKREIGEILQEFKDFQKRSIYRKTVFFLENMENAENIDFIRIFLNSHDITNVIMIAFTGDERLEFDLELREDPPNLMQKILPMENTPSGVRSREETEILNLFRVANSPVAADALPRLFSARLLPKIDQLIKKEQLFADSHQRTVSLGTGFPEPKVKQQQRLQILKSLAEEVGMAHAPDPVLFGIREKIGTGTISGTICAKRSPGSPIRARPGCPRRPCPFFQKPSITVGIGY